MPDLKITIGARIADLLNKMKNARQSVGSFAEKVTKAFAFAVAGRKLIQISNQIINRFDEMGKAARSIGIGVEQFQKLAFAARRNNMDLGRFSQSVQKMQRNIDDAGDGLTTAVRAFDKLGLKYRQLQGLKPDKQFQLITDRLNQVRDATTRVALANEIFGRSGRMILTMAGNYRELGQELERIGGLVDAEIVQSAEDAKDAIENLKSVLFATAGRTGFIEYVTAGLREIMRIATEMRDGGLLDAFEATSKPTATLSGRDYFESATRPVFRGLLFGSDTLGKKASEILSNTLFGRMSGGTVMSGAATSRQLENARREMDNQGTSGALGGSRLRSMTMAQIAQRDPFLSIGGLAPGGFQIPTEAAKIPRTLEQIEAHTRAAAEAIQIQIDPIAGALYGKPHRFANGAAAQ